MTPPDPLWAECEVRVVGGVPTLHRDGKPWFGFGACRPYFNDEVRCYARLAGAGLRCFQTDATCAEDIYHPDLRFWHEDGTFGSDAQEENFRRLEAIAPDAVWMLRCYVGAPPWWTARHPQECQVDADGSSVRPLQSAGAIKLPSLASEVWRRDICQAMEFYCAWLVEKGWSHRVFAILPCYGITWEWGILGSDHLPDYSEPAQAWFRHWIEKLYGTEAALRDAWRADVTFDTVQIPSADRRLASSQDGGSLRDPATLRDVIDHQRSLSAMNVELLLALCATIKRATRRRVLTVAFYGYTLTAREHTPFTGQFGAGGFVGGHHALSDVLASPHVDALASPYNYSNRRPGSGLLHGHAPEASIAASGKIVFHENDNYSFDNSPTDDPRLPALDVGVSSSWEENREMLRWAVGSAIARGQHQWCTELNGWLGPMAENFSNERVLDEIRRLNTLGEEWIHDDRRPVTEVAFVIEENAIAATHLDSKVFLDRVYRAHPGWGRLGFPFDLVLLEELIGREHCPYKAVVVAYAAPGAPRDLLEAWCAERGASLIYSTENGLWVAPASGLRETLMGHGLHTYAPAGINIWANHSHLLAQGPPTRATLRFRDASPLCEAFTGALCRPGPGGTLTWDFAAHPTALFRSPFVIYAQSHEPQQTDA